MSEAQLEAWCSSHALQMGWEHRKLDVGLGAKGWLDHIYAGPEGQTLLVEFKLPGEKVQPLKARRMLNLIRMRHRVHLIRTEAAFRQLLEEPLHPTPPPLVEELRLALKEADLPEPQQPRRRQR